MVLPRGKEPLGEWALVEAPEALVVANGVSVALRLVLENRGPGTIYWLRAHTAPAELALYRARGSGPLAPGEQREIIVGRVSWSQVHDPRPRVDELELELEGARGEKLTLPPIHITTQTPAFDWDEARWSDDGVTLRLDAVGNLPLENAVITASIGGQSLGRQQPPTLLPGTPANFTFPLPSGITPGDGQTISVELKTTALPFYRWAFDDRPILAPRSPWLTFLPGTLGVLVLLGTVAWMRRYRHPLVLELSGRPAAIRTLPVHRLREARRRLRQTGHLPRVLEASKVEPPWLDSAIRYLTTDRAQRAEALARRLAAVLETSENGGQEPMRWTLRLGPAFPLNLEKLTLVLPAADTPLDDLRTQLRNRPGRDTVALVVGYDAAQQEALHQALATDHTHQWAAPSATELTALLLSRDPPKELATLLARQVNRIRLSPYQTGQGLRRGEIFFGREAQLAHILNRAPASYLLVGGRQLGKSSLLRAIERQLVDDPEVECHYLVLETSTYDDQQLGQRLARCLGLDGEIGLEEILEYLAHPASDGRRRLLLIDESDALVRHERGREYRLFSRFRSLAEENRCHVVLAGFWDLYAAAALDYQAPIKNFGEVLTLGALEEEACHQLATRPMETLGLSWESETDRAELVRCTGQRANLMAIACHEILKNLAAEDREIGGQALAKALDSRAMANAVFGGWETLAGPDDREGSRLDRLVVYATVTRDHFTQAEVLGILDERGHPVSPERLRRTLERLEIAFVLRREGERYAYCVPLFVERLRAQEPDLLFDNELRSG